MSEAPKSPESIPQKWDQRLEKFGMIEALEGYLADYGITFRIAKDGRGHECMIVEMENVNYDPAWGGELKDPEKEYMGHNVQINDDAGTAKFTVPFRYVWAGFSEAIDSIQVKKDPETGERSLEQGPKNAHSGLFFFHIMDIDSPDKVMKYAFRTDYSDQDLARRRARRGK